MLNEEEEFAVLEEMEQNRRKRNFRAKLNSKNISKFEMDELFSE